MPGIRYVETFRSVAAYKTIPGTWYISPFGYVAPGKNNLGTIFDTLRLVVQHLH